MHSYWTALQLIERDPSPLEEAVPHNLRPQNIVAETAYLRTRPACERPYGWGWALLLAASAQTSSSEAVAIDAAEA